MLRLRLEPVTETLTRLLNVLLHKGGTVQNDSVNVNLFTSQSTYKMYAQGEATLATPPGLALGCGAELILGGRVVVRLDDLTHTGPMGIFPTANY